MCGEHVCMSAVPGGRGECHGTSADGPDAHRVAWILPHACRATYLDVPTERTDTRTSTTGDCGRLIRTVRTPPRVGITIHTWHLGLICAMWQRLHAPDGIGSEFRVCSVCSPWSPKSASCDLTPGLVRVARRDLKPSGEIFPPAQGNRDI